MRLGKVLTAQQNVKVALLGRKSEKNVGAPSLLHLADFFDRRDWLAQNSFQRQQPRGSPEISSLGCWKQPGRNRSRCDSRARAKQLLPLLLLRKMPGQKIAQHLDARGPRAARRR